MNEPPPPYRHLQVGWVLLVFLLPPVPLLWFASRASGSFLPLWVGIPIFVASAATFGTLTVEIDRSAVHLRFGLGLIRRRIPLAEIRAVAEVTNPWYFGWGIHYFAGGTLYNVSGLSAVELTLASGRRVRIGTDEPSQLYLALRRVVRPSSPSLPVPTPTSAHRASHLVWTILVCALCVGLGIPILLHYQARPPVVTLSSRTLTIDNLFYGQSYPVTDISKVELLPALPPIRLRTNGYAAGGTLRGWFTLDGLGHGKLFVEAGHPPFVVVLLHEGFVVINYADPVDTERLFAALRSVVEQR